MRPKFDETFLLISLGWFRDIGREGKGGVRSQIG